MGDADGTNQQEVQNFLLNQGIAAEDIAEAYDEYNRANSQPGASFYQPPTAYLQQNGYSQNQNGYSQQNQYNQKQYRQQVPTSQHAYNNNANYGQSNYRIQQETEVNVGSIQLPNI